MRRLLLGCSIALVTLLFGTLAILGCLLVPNGNALIWFARPWARAILRACGVRVRVAGTDNVPRDRPALFVTNHQSLFDVLALIRALPGQYRVIAKKELFSIPVFGWALGLAGFIKIDRTDRDRAFKSLELAEGKLRSGLPIVVFAEGTRSLDGRLLPFKKGGFVLAIKSGCPIVPISISGSRAVLSKNSLEIRRGTIDVVIGEAIETARYSIEKRDELIATVRRAIESGFTGLRELDLPASGPPGSPQGAMGV